MSLKVCPLKGCTTQKLVSELRVERAKYSEAAKRTQDTGSVDNRPGSGRS